MYNCVLVLYQQNVHGPSLSLGRDYNAIIQPQSVCGGDEGPFLYFVLTITCALEAKARKMFRIICMIKTFLVSEHCLSWATYYILFANRMLSNICFFLNIHYQMSNVVICESDRIWKATYLGR